MCLFGLLLNCQSFDDAISLAKYAKIVLTTAKATSDQKEALDGIQRSINDYEEICEPDTLKDLFWIWNKILKVLWVVMERNLKELNQILINFKERNLMM